MIGDFRSFSLSLPLGREGYKVRLIGILKHHRVGRASRTEVEQNILGGGGEGFVDSGWDEVSAKGCASLRTR